MRIYQVFKVIEIQQKIKHTKISVLMDFTFSNTEMRISREGQYRNLMSLFTPPSSCLSKFL